MKKNFYKLNKKEIYESAKEPKDGFVKTVYGTDGTSITYKRVVNNIKGIITGLQVKEISTKEGLKVKMLELSITEAAEVVNVLSAPYRNSKGSFTDEAKALISALRDYQVNEPISISASSKTTQGKNGKDYDNLSVYINYDNIKNEAGKNSSTGFIPYTEIPKPEIKSVAGESTYDFTTQTEFFYQELLAIIKKLGTPASSVTPSTPITPQQESGPVRQPMAHIAENDDLPF